MSIEKEQIDRSGWLILCTLSCLGFIAMYAETMVLPAIPAFITDFEIPYNTSSWILSSYMIAGAVATPIAGKLSDLYGRKKVLLTVLMIYAGGILAGGFANNLPFMLAARAAQGAGISMFPIAFGIIRESLPEKKLAIGQSVFTATFPGGATVGLLVGATIIQNYGWHATFFSVFPIAVILGFFIRKIIRQDNQKLFLKTKPSIDIKGSIVLAATVISFLIGVSFLENSSEQNWQSLISFVVASISLALLIFVEKKSRFPLLDFKLLKNPLLLFAILILLIVGLCTFMVYQTIPIMVQSPKPLGFGGTEQTTATVQLPFMVIFLIGSITAGFVLNKVGNKKLTAIGTLVSTIGFISLFLAHSSEQMVSFSLSIIAGGLSLALTGGFNIVLLSTPIQFAGITLGMTLLINLVGQSIGPTIAGMFQQMHRGTIQGISGSFPTSEAYNIIFLTATAVSLAAFVFSILLTRKAVTQSKI